MEDICRICYEGRQEHGEELISPCDCQGSLRFVHATCLNRWRLMNLENKNKTTCQLCLAKFRLKRDLKSRFWNAILSMEHLYEGFIRLGSALVFVPLSFGVIYVSNVFKDDVKMTDVNTKPWKQNPFGLLLPRHILKDINQIILHGTNEKDPGTKVSRLAIFIYGLSKVGSYGCTLWLLTDGMADYFPIHVINHLGERRPSPVLAILKAILEFYVIPFCLRTPESKKRLPFFLTGVMIGLLYVYHLIKQKLRAGLLGIVPYCKQLELGRLSER